MRHVLRNPIFILVALLTFSAPIGVQFAIARGSLGAAVAAFAVWIVAMGFYTMFAWAASRLGIRYMRWLIRAHKRGDFDLEDL